MKFFALFGRPVAHSISPRLHNAAFERLGWRGFYGRRELAAGVDGAGLVAAFDALGLSGANITIPFKQTALGECDFLDPLAAKIGAINTLVATREGGRRVLRGYNTDAPGFLRSVELFGVAVGGSAGAVGADFGVKQSSNSNLARDFGGGDFGGAKNPDGAITRAVILGAGGTARALAVALRERGVEVALLNRSDKSADFGGFAFFVPRENLGVGVGAAGGAQNTAQNLAQTSSNSNLAGGENSADGAGTNSNLAQNSADLASGAECGDFPELANVSGVAFDLARADLVVNTTPCGLLGDGLPFSRWVLARLLGAARFAFDAVYGRQTAFLRLARECGASAQDGAQMLLFQAVFAFGLFTQNAFGFDEIEAAMRPVLSLKSLR